ncbi:glycosyltransferase family 2 protein [Paucibacter sp. R3-3]|uniref:Glycosyltransferase family 2 protein n=1 Tax=Roseateles agri TaxID=3098619 RepID=A0ABU5DND8_9BURK|nr:glycosyltransferase family 2 protein [Paucibacter sp. R3-3]MDY0747243.1 glycosyltransferase family 2 protein [Paucibacter sp. R3-3]
MQLIDPTQFHSSSWDGSQAPVVNLVLPCYNEEAVLHETAGRLGALLDGLKAEGLIASASAAYYVDDGSRDGTWALIETLARERSDVCGLKLSRNRGHQNALLCGLMSISGDALISLDADLQDDLSIIPDMIRAFRNGDEVVYAVRRRRDADSFFKRFTAEGYYTALAMMGVEVVFNHADYRLLGRRPLEALRSYGETHLFLRGMVPQLGYRSSIVTFDRAERFAGESKYPLSKMLSLAWRGVTSFSAAPLRVITGLGMLVSLVSVAFGLWALFISLFTSMALPGWASTVIPMYLLGGIQLLSLGVIGEYLAKVYEAGKARPRFHVEAITGGWPGANTDR